jgi:hypothetical protein
MNTSNIDIDIIDTLDLINYTLSNKFVETWRFKYSEKFIKIFQLKLLEALSNQKPIKTKTLYLHLNKKGKYSKEQILNFFKSINLEIYYPIIYDEKKFLKSL